MSSESPAAIIYSSLGVEISSPGGSALTSTQPGLLIDGYCYSTGLSELLSVDSSGHPIVVGAGVSGTPSGGVLTVQGVGGGTALTVNNSTAANLLANVGGIGVAGSAPSGNPVYMGGSVTTSAPTYTTSTMNALSLDTSGNLRVTGAAGTFPVTGTVTANQGTANTLANAWPVELTDGYGHLFGELNNPFFIGGSGTAGSPSSNVVTIQGIVGGTAVPVSISGTVATTAAKSSTGTLTSVAASASSTTILASNGSRLGAAFFNDSASICYLAVSATAASTTAYTIKLMPGSYTDLDLDYTGQINAIWVTAVGNMRVTEWT